MESSGLVALGGGGKLTADITVVIADDQAVIRAGLRMIIDNEPDMTVLGEGADGAEALRLVRELSPDVVLMDVRMPQMDGIEATRRIRESGSDGTAVLVLTTFEEDEYVFGSLQAGAAGFLLKDAEPEALLAAIRSAAQGETVVDPAVAGRLVERWAELEAHGAPPRLPEDLGLTTREREVLVLLARGLSNRAMADELYLSEATVKTHVSHLLAKLGLQSRVQAVIAAYEHGVVRIGELELPPE